MRLLCGDLAPTELVAMSASEMASTAQKAQKAAWHARSMACAIKQDPRGVVGYLTDLYRCDSCDSTKTRVHRVIRPGRAIDRARTYATCAECNARWEI